MIRENARISSAYVGTAAFGRPAGQSPAARSRDRWGSTLRVALLILFAAPLLRAADCISIQEAGQHVGETRCVTGKVIRVKAGTNGVHFLDFCEDQLACPFTVVIFSYHLKDIVRRAPVSRPHR